MAHASRSMIALAVVCSLVNALPVAAQSVAPQYPRPAILPIAPPPRDQPPTPRVIVRPPPQNQSCTTGDCVSYNLSTQDECVMFDRRARLVLRWWTHDHPRRRRLIARRRRDRQDRGALARRGLRALRRARPTPMERHCVSPPLVQRRVERVVRRGRQRPGSQVQSREQHDAPHVVVLRGPRAPGARVPSEAVMRANEQNAWGATAPKEQPPNE
jgi:hypothetical protein